ncbi:MAG TPA: lipoyl(octanoyl) transferase LipB [Acidobacteriota bacterium]|nr:lipoyl(octanoyl) transferase LipB [Acidobacteriota bacterium]
MSEIAKECLAAFLGSAEYSRTLALQLRICELKKAGFEPDVLLLLEHPPTITLGRNGKWHNLLVSEGELEERGVRRYEVDRGGDITFHGPGQLIGYPLMRLDPGERDVHVFMWNLEESIVRLLREYGIEGGRVEKLTGVWTPAGKIAAMGIHISRWITRHGFALNVNTDLSYYDLIIPCGISGKSVASMETVLSRKIDLREVAQKYVHHFAHVYKRRTTMISERDLEENLERYSRP